MIMSELKEEMWLARDLDGATHLWEEQPVKDKLGRFVGNFQQMWIEDVFPLKLQKGECKKVRVTIEVIE